jgi:hypothetical protein
MPFKMKKIDDKEYLRTDRLLINDKESSAFLAPYSKNSPSLKNKQGINLESSFL